MNGTKIYCGFLAALCVSILTFSSVVSETALGAEVTKPVATDSGLVQGVMEDGIASFKGIPYAAPPVNELRWRPPQLPSSWNGVRQAEKAGPICPQNTRSVYPEEILSKYELSEDCLTLNIWTSVLESDQKLPVMVWIHSGSFRNGAGSMPRYDGAELAKQGVVLVTLNYRLGLFGLFAHPSLSEAQEGEALANYNFMDQVAALEWVQRNISAFGGDPDNVTVFGMSAGGVSINYLMTAPAAKGLFQKAASQSASHRSPQQHISQRRGSLPPLEEIGEQIAQSFDIEQGEDALARLRDLSVEQILLYQREGPRLLLNPVIDGKFLTESLDKTFRAGRQHNVPFLIGATTREGTAFAGVNVVEPILQIMSMTREQAQGLYGDLDVPTLKDSLLFDFFFGSQRYLARQMSTVSAPAYLYVFSYILDAHKDDFPGAPHGAETRYIFKTLHTYEQEEPSAVMGNIISQADLEMSNVVSSYWVDFAKTGNPNSGDRPYWPPFTTENEIVLEFGEEIVARENYLKDRLDYHDNIFEAQGTQ